MDRDGPRSGDYPRFLCERGDILGAQERWSEALPFLDRTLLAAPHDRDCLVERYFARQKTGDLLGATKDRSSRANSTPSTTTSPARSTGP